jgi:hypothetical protein
MKAAIVATVATIAIAGGGITIITGDDPVPPTDPGTANFWVDTNGGTCTRQSTAGAYVDAQACSSMNAAYQAASPGDVVRIKGGTYGGQTIAYDSGLTSASDIVIKAAVGEAVEFTGQVNVQGSHLTLDGTDDSDGYFRLRDGIEVETLSPNSPMREDITLRGVDAMGNQSSLSSVNDVLVEDSYFGGYHKSTGDSKGNDALRLNDNNNGVPTDITLDHVYIGEIGRGDSGPHNDCFEGSDGENLTIRYSRFWHCATQGLYLSGGASAQFDNVLVENNWFGPCSTPWQGFTGNFCSDIVIIEWDKPNTVFRYNSIGAQEGWRLGSNGPTGSVTVKGNAGKPPNCGASATSYDHNAWDTGSTACSGTDVTGDVQFTARPDNGGSWPPASGSTCTGFNATTLIVEPDLCWRIENHTFDYTIGASSVARNAGDPSSFPTTDIQGETRPIGTIDAGSDERS